jgi:hypothetical protein
VPEVGGSERRVLAMTAPHKPPYWTQWGEPRVILSLIGLFALGVVFWQTSVVHIRDPDIHLTEKYLASVFVTQKLRDEQDKTLAVEIGDLNESIDSLTSEIKELRKR